MKTRKKMKSKDVLELQDIDDQIDGRPVPFGALAELTSSDVIAEVKKGMSLFDPLEPLEADDENNDDDA